MAGHGWQGPQGWQGPRGGGGIGGGPGFGSMPGRGGQDDHRPPGMGGGPADRGAMAEAIFRRLDADHDGSITKAEFVSAHGRMHGPADARPHRGDRNDAQKNAAGKRKDRPRRGGDEEEDDE